MHLHSLGTPQRELALFELGLGLIATTASPAAARDKQALWMSPAVSGVTASVTVAAASTAARTASSLQRSAPSTALT